MPLKTNICKTCKASFVPETGLYKLHRGEKVTPATRQGGGKTIIFKPTFSFPGATIKKDIDIDSMMRRASRQAEINLRSMIGI